MEALRKIVDVTGGTVTVPVPDSFEAHKVEIIVLSLDSKEDEVETLSGTETDEKGWPVGFFSRIGGSLPDFPDIDTGRTTCSSLPLL